GTFNHFAKDVGSVPIGRAVDAVRAGTVTKVDVAYLNDELFLNTASVGAYTDFVEIRERYEHRVGKPLAALYAGLRTIGRRQALRVRVDEVTSDVDLLFLGNGRYLPRGFVPTEREQLDDGVLDLRMLDVSSTLARLSVLAALVTGRLARDPRYHEISAPALDLEILDGSVRVARDGELGETADRLRVRVERRALTVFRPADAPG
ncbi:diacylglycerol/lipid kinase family protein, partial [Nostocoides japonicum]